MAAPPVTKTWMLALAASSMVAETVVAPSNPLAMTSARSRLDVLQTLGPLRTTPSQHHATHKNLDALLRAGLLYSPSRPAVCDSPDEERAPKIRNATCSYLAFNRRLGIP